MFDSLVETNESVRTRLLEDLNDNPVNKFEKVESLLKSTYTQSINLLASMNTFTLMEASKDCPVGGRVRRGNYQERL